QRFLQRLWRLVIDEQTGEVAVSEEPADLPTRQATHRAIDGVSRDMTAMHFNTAIAKRGELATHLTRLERAPREATEPRLLRVAPLARHLAEGLRSQLGHEQSLSRAPYPVAEPALVKADTVTCVVQVRGKVRHRVQVDP